jgi:hypothetical protein
MNGSCQFVSLDVNDSTDINTVAVILDAGSIVHLVGVTRNADHWHSVVNSL